MSALRTTIRMGASGYTVHSVKGLPVMALDLNRLPSRDGTVREATGHDISRVAEAVCKMHGITGKMVKQRTHAKGYGMGKRKRAELPKQHAEPDSFVTASGLMVHLATEPSVHRM